MIDWIKSNYQWLFSGAGISIIMGLVLLIKSKRKSKIKKTSKSSSVMEKSPSGLVRRSDAEIKALTKILFVDDDTSFQVVKILKNTGWLNTKIIKDISNIDDQLVLDTDIFFVDINGVGLRLKFKDEGLGLALALKKTYPEKKIVIYSTVDSGNRFHEALRVADDTLSKQADPYEFITIVDNFAEKKYGYI